MAKPDGVKERRVILRTEMERFGYKPPSIQLSIKPVPAPPQPKVPTITPIVLEKPRERSTETAPIRKEHSKESREPKEPKEPSPSKVTERAPSVVEDQNTTRIQRTIYEVVNIRLEKPSKQVILQVRYGPTPNQMEWISASEVLVPESLAALQKAMIKVR